MCTVDEHSKTKDTAHLAELNWSLQKSTGGAQVMSHGHAASDQAHVSHAMGRPPE